ncbi:MAG: type I restriction-modification system subunit M N-terminal domain-containing protein [Sideroxyarcus sp.]|nr:type I restriction-modification system subunit M N-terminal domain-containing protein [Sideroxyarcus sp.]
MNQQALSPFIRPVAELLRGDFKQSEQGKVILPFKVLRRLNCVLEATKPALLAEPDKQPMAVQKGTSNNSDFVIPAKAEIQCFTSWA